MDDARRLELIAAIDAEIEQLDRIARKFLNYDPESIRRDRNMFALAIRRPVALMTSIREELQREIERID